MNATAEAKTIENRRKTSSGIGTFWITNCRPTPLRRLLATGCTLLLLTVGAAGCKKSTGVVPIHGNVSFRGKPLANASLTFFPKSGRPIAVSIDQGQYATEMLPGEYSATVSVAIEIPNGYQEGQPLPPPKVVLPE